MFKILIIAVILVTILKHQVRIASCDDTIDPDAAKSTDKDPWDKWSKLPSSGKAHSNNQNSNNDDSDEGEVDVTETTTTEVHTKSKINNNDKKRTKQGKKGASSTNNNINQNVDNETKEQFKDAVDETVCSPYFFKKGLDYLVPVLL